ncbi:sporulation protein YqfD [Paenibacillus sp. IB182496]|uniref:Sporulation protein YqfD n=1 Tax=Paenibacillus sabuli TaxID=2772509 RepID=A0A927BPR3_9BACL|nr:sporulation protein YqfD [Paenibacillus sabuli]MBD2844451.1 sporulation protein YqfD [Paenibacillus sabuli]
MNTSWLQTVKGMVTVTIRGGRQEMLINEAASAGIRLWAIRRTSPEQMVCEISVSDFFRLRPLLKRTGCRVHVAARRGLPFWLVRLERRKFFAAGLFLFMCGLYVLSSLVWRVEVAGNDKLTEDDILAAARAEGIYEHQWTWRMEEADVLSKNLARRLPGAAWVGVQRQGTTIRIEVVENTMPEEQPLYTPRHLVAAADAVVTAIEAENGRPVVKRNTKVKRGDILISGTIGEGEHTRTVVAKGEVRGLVWKEYDIEVPLTQEVKVYTGASRLKRHLLIGERTLQISGYGAAPYAQYETVESRSQMAWRGFRLRLGTVEERQLEIRTDRRQLTAEEARAVGLLQAKADILAQNGNETKVVGQNILHEKTENGKVYMKVFFEVEQSIVTEMPIVQMQGE